MPALQIAPHGLRPPAQSTCCNGRACYHALRHPSTPLNAACTPPLAAAPWPLELVAFDVGYNAGPYFQLMADDRGSGANDNLQVSPSCHASSHCEISVCPSRSPARLPARPPTRPPLRKMTNKLNKIYLTQLYINPARHSGMLPEIRQAICLQAYL